MKEAFFIGVDLGASNVRAGLLMGLDPGPVCAQPIHSTGSVEEVLEDLYAVIDPIFSREVKAIGVGVPSVVDPAEGVVYDVQYIPSWKQVPLRAILEKRYGVSVHVNNDANCFALGEYYFGKGRGMDSMIGLTIGTGLGAGILIQGRLYAGPHCGAGEFGMVDYLDRCFEYYASGQYFQNRYQTDGQLVFARAKSGDPEARRWYAEMGMHLGNAIKMILYTYDPELIVLGGSVAHAYEYFSAAMWERIRTFAYQKSLEELKLECSELAHSGVLGAAALCLDADRKP